MVSRHTRVVHFQKNCNENRNDPSLKLETLQHQCYTSNMNTSSTNEIISRVTAMICKRTVAALEKHDFTAIYCSTAAEATAHILRATVGAKTIGLGASMTVSALSIETTLIAQGAEILNHLTPGITFEQQNNILRAQQTCDMFISSANALTTSGEIVNVDGVGNRVSASTYGPKKIILVVGRNKIVEGDVADAIRRVKNIAAAANSIRLNKNTPCATKGYCTDCDSHERICRVTMIMERKPTRSDITVLVVNEDLGY